MEDQKKQIIQLQAKLDKLVRDQESLEKDIQSLRSEINSMAGSVDMNTPAVSKVTEKTFPQKEPKPPAGIQQHSRVKESGKSSRFPALVRTNLEEFIGGNLINKIGIIILILGVGIGIKFAIDRELISPLVRLILGYLVGALLLFFSFRTRRDYQNFSAVLVSGALATTYFITYAGHVYYSIIPQAMAYIMMIAITAYSVYTSLSYDKEIIALIGLVGAYAIPFLIGRKSEDYTVLFIYISIINAGILLVSIKKYWRWILYGAFIVTWLLFIIWQRNVYSPGTDIHTSLIFGFIFFGLFYLTFINHKLFNEKQFSFEDILLLISNSFIFYGVGYYTLMGYAPAEKFVGLFTLGNAGLHLVAAGFFIKKQHPDMNLRQFLIGMAIAFLTIAIAVQFESNWITLFWFIEAMILLYIGRSRSAAFYEYISYVVVVLGFYSLLLDWSSAYASYHIDNPQSRVAPFINAYFLTGFFALISAAFINYIHFGNRFPEGPVKDPTLKNMIDYGLAGILIFIGYYMFRNEVAIYWNQQYIDSDIPVPLQSESGGTYLLRNPDIRFFKIIWILTYTLLFGGILTFLNAFVLKLRKMVLPVILINSSFILVFLIQGLWVLSELRENYLNPSISPAFNPGSWNIGIRYLGLATLIGMVLFNYWYTRNQRKGKRADMMIDLFTGLVFLWVLSSEVIHWKDLHRAGESYKIGLSILWGLYSLLLVILGIWKRKKYLRIAAISLFGITLVKLFFYDLTDLDTISKTIVFISLGILLLVISFLYNKYRKILFE